MGGVMFERARRFASRLTISTEFTESEFYRTANDTVSGDRVF